MYHSWHPSSHLSCCKSYGDFPKLTLQDADHHSKVYWSNVFSTFRCLNRDSMFVFLPFSAYSNHFQPRFMSGQCGPGMSQRCGRQTFWEFPFRLQRNVLRWLFAILNGRSIFLKRLRWQNMVRLYGWRIKRWWTTIVGELPRDVDLSP